MLTSMLRFASLHWSIPPPLTLVVTAIRMTHSPNSSITTSHSVTTPLVQPFMYLNFLTPGEQRYVRWSWDVLLSVGLYRELAASSKQVFLRKQEKEACLSHATSFVALDSPQCLELLFITAILGIDLTLSVAWFLSQHFLMQHQY